MPQQRRALLAEDPGEHLGAYYDAWWNFYRPRVQPALVLHLESLNDVANRASFIQLAASQGDVEGDALRDRTVRAAPVVLSINLESALDKIG